MFDPHWPRWSLLVGIVGFGVLALAGSELRLTSSNGNSILILGFMCFVTAILCSLVLMTMPPSRGGKDSLRWMRLLALAVLVALACGLLTTTAIVASHFDSASKDGDIGPTKVEPTDDDKPREQTDEPAGSGSLQLGKLNVVSGRWMWIGAILTIAGAAIVILSRSHMAAWGLGLSLAGVLTCQLSLEVELPLSADLTLSRSAASGAAIAYKSEGRSSPFESGKFRVACNRPDDFAGFRNELASNATIVAVMVIGHADQRRFRGLNEDGAKTNWQLANKRAESWARCFCPEQFPEPPAERESPQASTSRGRCIWTAAGPVTHGQGLSEAELVEDRTVEVYSLRLSTDEKKADRWRISLGSTGQGKPFAPKGGRSSGGGGVIGIAPISPTSLAMVIP